DAAVTGSPGTRTGRAPRPRPIIGHARLHAGRRALRIAMLGVADVAGYLLDHRLLDPRAVVHGGLRIFDSSRLNRVFIVSADEARCLVVKVGPGVAHEAAVLERLRLAGGSGGVGTSLPAVVSHDRA